VNVWIAAARPRTLGAAIAPIAVGSACAHAVDAIAPGPALAALGGALAIQIGTNFANDVFDARRGADGPERIGPVRAVSAGLIAPRAMLAAMTAAFAIAAALGLYLVAVAGWPIVAIGIASIAAGIAYTGGPWPLGYHGLGDLFVLAFFGFVAVCGTAFVQLGEVPALAVWASLPVGALATAILVVNNLRDRTTDARAGKRTLAVRLGRRGTLVEYAGLLAIAYAIPGALALDLGPSSAIPAATAPLAWRCAKRLAGAATGPEYNACLAATARLALVHGLLFALGLVLA
jgi:1,4-dihydroxy-2-naphthoate octaprenyltransferase